MPVEIEKEVTTKKSGDGAAEVSQTATTTKVPTTGEVQDAQADRGNAWIWYVVGVIDILIALRLLFLLFGARSVGFADFLYMITNPLIAPFRGIFPAPDIDGAYFDTASLVAIIVYILLGYVLARLIDLATRPATSKKV